MGAAEITIIVIAVLIVVGVTAAVVRGAADATDVRTALIAEEGKT